jgi:hypothetical protein
MALTLPGCKGRVPFVAFFERHPGKVFSYTGSTRGEVRLKSFEPGRLAAGIPPGHPFGPHVGVEAPASWLRSEIQKYKNTKSENTLIDNGHADSGYAALPGQKISASWAMFGYGIVIGQFKEGSHLGLLTGVQNKKTSGTAGHSAAATGSLARIA